MPDYELTRLGSRAFEQLVVSLCHRVIGPGLQVFGDGSDGGREATFDGTINWSATAPDSTAPEDRWRGYTVLQSKFMQKPKPKPLDNAKWLQGQIRDEIGRWTTACDEETRTRYPDYLIFVTNVDLSPVARTGGMDTVQTYVSGLLGAGSEAYKAGLRVRDFKIWHGDQVRTMIDDHQNIRAAFDGLLTIGDVLSALHAERPELGSLNLTDPLRSELVAALKNDRWIRLSESGGAGNDKMWLDDVVVDLPAVIGDRGDTDAAVRAVRHVLERGDTVLRPRQADRTGAPGVVLVGGPGQGKTTLSQLIAQSYRVAMLKDTDLAPAAREIVEATGVALNRLGLSAPANRRWPIRVDLAKYAEHLSTGEDTSLLRWISKQVTKRSVVEVQPAQLDTWLRICPWALILDGLDEVPSLDARRALYAQIDGFIDRAEDIDADLLLVLTTRPTGYDERLPEPWFEHLNLRPLPPAESAQFAARLTAKRFENDPEMRAEVAARMAQAAADTTTARLMETPLQVTVMSMIVEKFPTLPPDRFTLFNLYYQTMYDREVAKGIAISRFLSDHRQYIDGIHEHVGLFLQAQSETAAHAEAVLLPDELRTLAVNLLVVRGYARPEAEQTADRMVEAAVHRLVLLVPRDAGLGYEIRTLQELMAARAVSEGSDEQVIDRLRLLADHPHWRNTWLLAAGRLLTTSARFEDLIADLLRHLGDGRGTLGRQISAGPAIAAALLDDAVAAHRPGFERSLVQVVLSVIEYPPVGDLRSVALSLDRLLDGRYRTIVVDRLTAAAGSGIARRATAASVLDLMAGFAGAPARRHSIELARARLRLSTDEDAAVSAFQASPRQPTEAGHSGESVAAALVQAAQGVGLTVEETTKLTAGLAAVGASRFVVTATEPGVAVLTHVDLADPPALLDVVGDTELGTALELGLSSLPIEHWSIPALVAGALYAANSRRPVAEQILVAVMPGTSSTASS